MCLVAWKGQFGRFQDSKNKKSYQCVCIINDRSLYLSSCQSPLGFSSSSAVATQLLPVARSQSGPEMWESRNWFDQHVPGFTQLWCWDANVDVDQFYSRLFDRIVAGQLDEFDWLQQTGFLWPQGSLRILIFHVVYSIYRLREEWNTPTSHLKAATMIWRLQVIMFLLMVAN